MAELPRPVQSTVDVGLGREQLKISEATHPSDNTGEERTLASFS